MIDWLCSILDANGIEWQGWSVGRAYRTSLTIKRAGQGVWIPIDELFAGEVEAAKPAPYKKPLTTEVVMTKTGVAPISSAEQFIKLAQSPLGYVVDKRQK